MSVAAGHRVFESISRAGNSGEAPRLRAFCSCGWVSDTTWVEGTFRAEIAKHLAAFASPGTLTVDGETVPYTGVPA